MANVPLQWYPEWLVRVSVLKAASVAHRSSLILFSVQLIVTGGGSQTPSGSYLTTFPGAYSMSDPSVNIDIYDGRRIYQSGGCV